jgi:hypothetical protein
MQHRMLDLYMYTVGSQEIIASYPLSLNDHNTHGAGTTKALPMQAECSRCVARSITVRHGHDPISNSTPKREEEQV